LLRSLEEEGLDKKKLILTINNLKDSDRSIKFYLDRNLNENAVFADTIKKDRTQSFEVKDVDLQSGYETKPLKAAKVKDDKISGIYVTSQQFSNIVFPLNNSDIIDSLVTKKSETQFEMIKKLELDRSAHAELMDYCKQKNI
jgi:hypothetical protein